MEIRRRSSEVAYLSVFVEIFADLGLLTFLFHQCYFCLFLQASICLFCLLPFSRLSVLSLRLIQSAVQGRLFDSSN